MIPLLLEANVSIKESTSRIPTATDNINNVSKMTETSTNEVLDSIETITSKLNDLGEMIKSDKSKDEQITQLDDVSNMVNEIIFAFQFQDITTQKLEHTSRILKTVHDKFVALFKSFEKMRDNSELGSEVAKAIEHEFEKEKNKGLENQEYFEKNTKDIMRQNVEISQEDIDNFFK
jgi:chemotaxis regulatin CheY-phosphate phosphatase CheZ